jgi:AcrR family transcriptional regulator
MIRIVKDPTERRLEIISTARQLFLQHDYEHTSMKDIMDKLKIAKGTIYHYFKSKEELLEAVVEQIVDDYLSELQTVFDKIQGNALDKLRVLINASNVAEEKSELLEQLHRPGNIAMHTRQLAITVSKITPLYAKIIEQGCHEGVFKTNYPLESIEFLLAGIQFMTDIGIHPWSKTDLIRRATAMPSILEAQLGAPKGSFNFLINNNKRG